MQSTQPAMTKLSAVRRDMLRGDSVFAVTILIVVALFLLNLVASLWNNAVFQKNVKERAGAQRIKMVGHVLARASEALIATNELSMLRRTVAETGLEHNLQACRIVLPGGEVLADANPSGITLIEPPPSWKNEPGTFSEAFTRRGVRLAYPLIVPGKGSAMLEVSARIDDPVDSMTPQTAQMSIACLALASMLLVHRHTRFRLKAIGAIHEILLAVTDDDADFATLELDPSLGTEAVAWNRLLGARQSLRMRTAIEQVKEAVHDRSDTVTALGLAFDTAPYGLVLVNQNLAIEHVNGAAAVFLQKDKDQLIHADFCQIVTNEPAQAAVRQATKNPAAKRAVLEVEGGGSAAAGLLRFTVTSLRHEDSQYALVTLEDITQQRVAQGAMNSFLAKAAHELRTPLTNIRLFVEEALEQCEHDAVATSKSLNVINEESQRLERTVGEVLSVSQIEAGSFGIMRDDIHLDALLEQVRADYEAQARDKRITLEFNLPPKLPILQADRVKIALTLHNLVGNALKYTPEGGRVTVTAAGEKGQVSIAVADTGIGIGPEDVERVFEKFYRCKNAVDAKIKGSGLGLPIAREVARLHGGDVTVESEPGQGSTFTLTLPVAMETA